MPLNLKHGDVKIGDVVTYVTFGGGTRTVTVTNVEEDIKNGAPGFDGELVDGPEKGSLVWGYLHQITRVYP